MNAPEWRRERGDAVLDGETMMESDKWKGYKILTTTFNPWRGRTETWFKAEQNGRRPEPWAMEQ